MCMRHTNHHACTIYDRKSICWPHWVSILIPNTSYPSHDAKTYGRTRLTFYEHYICIWISQTQTQTADTCTKCRETFSDFISIMERKKSSTLTHLHHTRWIRYAQWILWALCTRDGNDAIKWFKLLLMHWSVPSRCLTIRWRISFFAFSMWE